MGKTGNLLLSVVAIGFIGAAACSASARTTTSVRHFTDGSVVPGSAASLVRSGDGASMTLRTADLTQGRTVTVFWVIFNKPQDCSHGHFRLRCGPGDLPPLGGNGSAQPSALPANATTIGPGGDAAFGAFLKVGDTSGALFGPGLTNPQGADIHLVVCDGTQFGPTCVTQFSAFEA